MTVTKVDDLFDGVTTQCGSAQFYGYHDPNVHVLLILVFGIFALVFLYYFIRRRPRTEYGLMIVWSVLEVASFVLRLFSDINYAFIGIMVYTVAITLSLYVVYSLFVRWTRIADIYYNQDYFYKGWGGKIASPILTILFLGFIVISVWIASIMWIIDLALYAILWIMLIIVLILHRRKKPDYAEKTIYMSMMEKKYNLVQIATSHKLLDNMIVFLIVTASIQLVKLIFLTVCYVFIPLFFIAPLYYIFCITPDIAFAVFLANTETVTLFEPSRHVPSARNNLTGPGDSGYYPQDASYAGANSMGQYGQVTPFQPSAPPALDAEPTEVTVMPR